MAGNYQRWLTVFPSVEVSAQPRVVDPEVDPQSSQAAVDFDETDSKGLVSGNTNNESPTVPHGGLTHPEDVTGNLRLGKCPDDVPSGTSTDQGAGGAVAYTGRVGEPVLGLPTMFPDGCFTHSSTVRTRLSPKRVAT